MTGYERHELRQEAKTALKVFTLDEEEIAYKDVDNGLILLTKNVRSYIEWLEGKIAEEREKLKRIKRLFTETIDLGFMPDELKDL